MTNFNFHIQIGDTFSIADLDLDKLEKHTLLEYPMFLNNPKDNDLKNRSVMIHLTAQLLNII